MSGLLITRDMQKNHDYSWRKNLPHYGFRIKDTQEEQLCSGVTYMYRNYIRNDGKNVQAHIVIVSENASVVPVVWGSPQGQSQTVPEHVAQMEKMGKRVIAAVNGDFFHFFNDGDKTTCGAQIIDGIVYKEPNKREKYGDNWFGVTNDGEYIMSDMEDYERKYKGKLQQAIGGGVWLMRDHLLCSHRGPQVEPRTAVAITDDEELILVCVDGRSEQSAGATYADLLQVFLDLELPVRTVLNLDGGGSTIMMGKGQDGVMKIRNSPSTENSELRPVADILALTKGEAR